MCSCAALPARSRLLIIHSILSPPFYVQAFFKKRNLKVMRQKLARGEPIGVKKTLEELDDELDDAEEEEEDLKEEYEDEVAGKKKKSKGYACQTVYTSTAYLGRRTRLCTPAHDAYSLFPCFVILYLHLHVVHTHRDERKDEAVAPAKVDKNDPYGMGSSSEYREVSEDMFM